jgi:3-oxoacyl-[acyl-carrier-protein] synthase II
MGEEAAGVDAVRIAHARVQSCQSDITLVGGALNAERRDVLLLYETGGCVLKAPFAPVWERSARGGGMVLGSLGAFLVLEASGHARARNAKPLARLASVHADRSARRPGDVTRSLAAMWEKLAPQRISGRTGIISGACGTEPATSEEQAWLASIPEIAVRATGTYVGHSVEPQFPMNIALATLAIGHEKFFAPASGSERGMDAPLNQVVVTGVGHWRGEGMALVEAVQ